MGRTTLLRFSLPQTRSCTTSDVHRAKQIYALLRETHALVRCKMSDWSFTQLCYCDWLVVTNIPIPTESAATHERSKLREPPSVDLQQKICHHPFTEVVHLACVAATHPPSMLVDRRAPPSRTARYLMPISQPSIFHWPKNRQTNAQPIVPPLIISLHRARLPQTQTPGLGVFFVSASSPTTTVRENRQVIPPHCGADQYHTASLCD